MRLEVLDGWKQNISKMYALLESLSVQDIQGISLEADVGFARLTEWTSRVHVEERSIYFLGNGASASMASHFAADMSKNGGVRAEVFTDLSLLTALANDLSYEEVYAEPLRWYLKKGDMVIAISSSGNSPNIVRAVNQARSLGGKVITLSAMSKNNSIRKLGDLNFYVEAQTYGLAETAHAAILHYWMDLVEAKRKNTKCDVSDNL
jgi:D-sedoheptulose 7-phosphate isomerase